MRKLLARLNAVFFSQFLVPVSWITIEKGIMGNVREHGKDRGGAKGQLQKTRDSCTERMSMLLISTKRVANWQGREGSLNTYNCGISCREGDTGVS